MNMISISTLPIPYQYPTVHITIAPIAATAVVAMDRPGGAFSVMVVTVRIVGTTTDESSETTSTFTRQMLIQLSQKLAKMKLKGNEK